METGMLKLRYGTGFVPVRSCSWKKVVPCLPYKITGVAAPTARQGGGNGINTGFKGSGIYLAALFCFQRSQARQPEPERNDPDSLPMGNLCGAKFLFVGFKVRYYKRKLFASLETYTLYQKAIVLGKIMPIQYVVF